MANHQKNVKKAATKPGKMAGAAKVPRYEQREAANELNPPGLPPKAKK